MDGQIDGRGRDGRMEVDGRVESSETTGLGCFCTAIQGVRKVALKYCGREVRSYLCARGAYHITLLHQRVERPGLDGLIEQKISDQTVQVWLTRCQRGKSYVVRPARKKDDLTSLPQYSLLVPRNSAGVSASPEPVRTGARV